MRALSIPDRLARLAGGPARARVILLLGSVLALQTADVATIGAVGRKLETSLSLDNTQLGLLAATPAIVAALATIPIGVYTDRINRVRIIWVSMLFWTLAQGASGFSPSFEFLLLTRLALGAATATAGPPVTSLVGDFFPANERARIWGLILSGELIGAGFGYLISGELASFGSWRYAFFALAGPSVLIALAVRRWLIEPARGGRGRIPRGATELTSGPGSGEEDEFEVTETQEQVEAQRFAPQPELVLHSDPERMSLWDATRYVLRIRSNVVLIVASALGYFYFTGVQTFGLVFFEERFHVAQGTATLLLMLLGIGGLVGVILGGRLADRLLHQGRINARIVVSGASYLLAAGLFLPGLLSGSIVVALPFFVAAAAAFGGREAPLDAARLDIVHHRLWGRAEAVRTFLRQAVIASAPIVFGLIADSLAPPAAHAKASGQTGFGANANAHGLRLAFLILLVTLAVGGVLTLFARRTFPRDVASALASETATDPVAAAC
jgi:MFS family permease